jgi:hypothetical protein
VGEYDGGESYPRAAGAVASETDKPLVVLSSVASAVDQAQAGPLRDLGVPVLEGARSGMRGPSLRSGLSFVLSPIVIGR